MGGTNVVAARLVGSPPVAVPMSSILFLLCCCSRRKDRIDNTSISIPVIANSNTTTVLERRSIRTQQLSGGIRSYVLLVSSCGRVTSGMATDDERLWSSTATAATTTLPSLVGNESIVAVAAGTETVFFMIVQEREDELVGHDIATVIQVRTGLIDSHRLASFRWWCKFWKVFKCV
jgi:hypothetical protein